MDTPSTSKTRPASSSKPKIDPLQLLKCLSILLNVKGGIQGDTEVPRVKGLMAKYSKKLVSKCIYLNILQATDLALLDAFYDEGGWELVGIWLQEAVKASNWPLAMQVLSLLDTSPMTVSRLKRYTTPKLVKELSRDCTSTDVQSVAKRIVLKWMEVVRQGDGTGVAAGVGLSSGGGQSNGESPMDIDTTEDDSNGLVTKEEAQTKLGSSEVPANIDSSQECGDGSSSMEGQDDSSNASTESEGVPALRTPIRITIRSGSQVLAKVSNQRISQDSNDSDDNKPLSLIKREVEKSRKSTSEEEADESSASGMTSEETPVLPVTNSSSPVNSSTATVDAVSALTARCTVSSDNSNSSTENVNTTTTTTAVHTVVTFSGSQAVSPTSPSSSNQEGGGSPMETNSEVDNSNDKYNNVKTVKSQIQEKDPSESSDNNKADAEIKDDKSDFKNEKEIKNYKDKSKEKDKDKENEKRDRDRKDRDREKDKKSRDDKKREREKEATKSSRSSSSSTGSSRSREKEKNSRDRERSKSGDKYRSSTQSKSRHDKDRRDRDKDKKSSSTGSKDKSSKDKEKDDKHDQKKKKVQENENIKATLEKVKPLSADGLAKIPKKITPSSFLDALGSGDLDLAESKKPSIKTYKSRGFRNTGLLDEPTKPPVKKTSGTGSVLAEKKTAVGSEVQGVKRSSPLDDLVASLPDKRLKSSVSSYPATTDKPGGAKLISPKRHSISDDGGFMAALTEGRPATRKKVGRKRRSSESDPKADNSAATPTKEDDKDKKESDEKSPTSSPIKADDKGILSPTSVKPTFNFYQETLKDEVSEDKDEDKDNDNDNEKDKNEENEMDTKEDKESEANTGDVEMKEEDTKEGDTKEEDTQDDDDNMDLEESEDQDSIQIGIGDNSFGGGGGGINTGEADLRDEDIPIAPAVPAPAHEDYEKVEVTFSNSNLVNVQGILVYHRSENRKKKTVKFKTEDDLQQVTYFELDETERVNVNNIKFGDMMVMERQREREAMGKNRGFHHIGGMNMMDGSMMGMGMLPGQHDGIAYMRWSLLPIMIPNPSTVSPGYKSQERIIQSARESSTIAAFYHPAMMPETPREPDPEMVSRVEPKQIPLNDATGQDTVYDHRNKLWPEPIFGEPTNYGYGPMGAPLPSSGSDGGGSHWVVGGPPAGAFPGPGGPMYGPPGGFGGPGMGGQGMGGPGNFGGDMAGGMDVQGWGGPGPGPGPGPGLDYPNPNMMMGGNGQGMMMGGGGGGGGGGRPGAGGPRGMGMPPGPPMGGMGGHNFRGGRSGPGGNWGPGSGGNYGKPFPLCKHFMNGHCRHNKSCRFSHSRH